MLIPKLANRQIRVKAPITTSRYSFIKRCPVSTSSNLCFINKNIVSVNTHTINGLQFGTRGFAAKVTNLDKEIGHAKQIIHREVNIEDNKKFGNELKELFAQGRYTEAFDKYDTFRRYQVVSTENIVLVMKYYMQLQRFGKVRDLFFHLKAHQVQPAVEVYELLIESTFLEKNRDKLVSFFKRMISDGWNPTDYVLQTVVRSHMQQERLEAMEQLLKEFKENHDYQWNTLVLNDYISFAFEKGHQSRAEQLAFNKDLPRDELSYARLIKYYLDTQAMDKIEKAVEHLRQFNLHRFPSKLIPDPRFQNMNIPKLTFRISYTPEAATVGVAWEGGSRAFHLGSVSSEWEAHLLGLNVALSMCDLNALEEVAITSPALINALSTVNQKGMDEIPWSNTPFALLLRNILKFLGQSPKGVKISAVSIHDQDWKPLANAAIKAAKKEREHILYDPVVNPSSIIPSSFVPEYIRLVEGIKAPSAASNTQ